MQELPIASFALPIAVPVEQRILNAESSKARGLPQFIDLPECQLGRYGRAALVSGGPSAADQLEIIRKFEIVIACGSAYGWLIDHDIVPEYCVIFDAGDDQARFYKDPHPGTFFLVASTCDPSVFDALDGYKVRVWHPFDDLPHRPGDALIGGGSTVTLRAVALSHIMGYRELHMFGFDSSYGGGFEHAYPYAQDRPAPMQVTYQGRTFITTPQLLSQAREFMAIYHDHQHELSVKVYGDGMIAHMLGESSLINLEPLDA